MVTIPVQVSEELAEQLLPLQDRLTEIIELGMRQIKAQPKREMEAERKSHMLAALHSTGLVTLPNASARPEGYVRHPPIQAGGKPASEIIIEQRGPRI
jgi:hypothetical protein